MSDESLLTRFNGRFEYGVSRDLSADGVFVERSSRDLCRRRAVGVRESAHWFFLDNQRPQFVAINSDRARVTTRKISSARNRPREQQIKKLMAKKRRPRGADNYLPLDAWRLHSAENWQEKIFVEKIFFNPAVLGKNSSLASFSKFVNYIGVRPGAKIHKFYNSSP